MADEDSWLDFDLHGKPEDCPFCGDVADSETGDFWFNGGGPPPSYAYCCGNCGAQGPTGLGRERGDHTGAKISAIRQWNQRASQPPST